MKFIEFRDLVNTQLGIMTRHPLFEVDVDRDVIKDKYLSSFLDGDNPIYKENTEHDCSCCKAFIRNLGKAVAIIDGKLVTVWDVAAEGKYKPVAESMSKFIKSLPIKGIYLNEEVTVGQKGNKELIEGKIKVWDHFYYKLPTTLVDSDPAQKKGDFLSSKSVLQRSLEEISVESIEIVLGLIASKSIYRGEEHLKTVKALSKCKKAYDKLNNEDKELFLWTSTAKLGHGGRFRNTVIGTLMSDISEGVELEKAVKSFESKVAPDNYKRPKSLITKGMVEKAEKEIVKLGLQDDLQRRFANESDLTINNILFANKDTKPKLAGESGILGMLKDDIKPNTKQNLKGVKEVGIQDFIDNILPKAETLELMLANKHTSNLMSLVAPTNSNTSNNLLRWGNNFTWSYNGEVADSMKERVKAKGGDVSGDVRFSIQWNEDGKSNGDDLDAWCVQPVGETIYFINKGIVHDTTGKLDVDITQPNGNVAVENITFSNRYRMTAGDYQFRVNNYSNRGGRDFTAQVEILGDIYEYSFTGNVKRNVKVATVTSDGQGNFTIKHHLETSTSQKEAWNIKTNDWVPVKMVLNSPNHWDGEETGNKHWFFILDGCNNPDDVRGFYNEFLNPALTEHRKVFEILASKMKAKHVDDQLSGVGFSSTKEDDILCKVGGSFNRVIKLKF